MEVRGRKCNHLAEALEAEPAAAAVALLASCRLGIRLAELLELALDRLPPLADGGLRLGVGSDLRLHLGERFALRVEKQVAL